MGFIVENPLFLLDEVIFWDDVLMLKVLKGGSDLVVVTSCPEKGVFDLRNNKGVEFWSNFDDDFKLRSFIIKGVYCFGLRDFLKDYLEKEKGKFYLTFDYEDGIYYLNSLWYLGFSSGKELGLLSNLDWRMVKRVIIGNAWVMEPFKWFINTYFFGVEFSMKAFSSGEGKKILDLLYKTYKDDVVSVVEFRRDKDSEEYTLYFNTSKEANPRKKVLRGDFLLRFYDLGALYFLLNEQNKSIKEILNKLKLFYDFEFSKRGIILFEVN